MTKMQFFQTSSDFSGPVISDVMYELDTLKKDQKNIIISVPYQIIGHRFTAILCSDLIFQIAITPDKRGISR